MNAASPFGKIEAGMRAFIASRNPGTALSAFN